MADGVEFDLSELTKLSADLGDVPKNAGPLINSAIQGTSVNIKKAAQKTVGQRRHFKKAAAAIDYEVKVVFGQLIQSEIGYDKEKVVGTSKKGGPATPGNLGNLIEFGAPGSKNALAPTSDLANALHANEADFQRGLNNALSDAEREAGL